MPFTKSKKTNMNFTGLKNNQHIFTLKKLEKGYNYLSFETFGIAVPGGRSQNIRNKQK